MYWSFSDIICYGSIEWRREARRECAYSYKCFKSWHLAIIKNLVSTTWRRHAVCKSAVLNSSPRDPPPHPRSAHFACYSYSFKCLFYLNLSSLRSGHHSIFQFERTYSIQSAYKCARRELKLYISEVYDVTLVCAWRCCAAHEWMFRSEVNYNGFPLLRE